VTEYRQNRASTALHLDRRKHRQREWKATLWLAAPLVLSELGWMAMNIEDAMFVGHISAEALGAVGLGGNLFYSMAILAQGLLLGMDTLISQAFGAGDHDDCRHSLIQGTWLALFLIPLVMGVVWLAIPLLPVLGINPQVVPATIPYLKALIWGTAPLLFFFAFRRYLQSIGVVRPILWTLIVANGVNLLGNWIFVFGNLGAPALGATGSGWATFFSRVFMMAALAAIIVRHDPRMLQASKSIDWARIGKLLRLGIPAAGQIGFEYTVYLIVTLVIGRFPAAILAGHQITLTTVSTTYMMPLGISSAASVRVGHAIGRGDGAAAARAGWTAIGLGAMVMSCAAMVLLFAPRWIAGAFAPEPEVIAAALPLLRAAAFFQLFDGMQVVATGALRGAGNTRVPMLSHLVGYWAIGLPLGLVLCFGLGWQATGLWIGLATGLILIGVFLLFYWRKAARRLASVL
jgi:MATE family multidrug resistance protein